MSKLGDPAKAPVLWAEINLEDFAAPDLFSAVGLPRPQTSLAHTTE